MPTYNINTETPLPDKHRVIETISALDNGKPWQITIQRLKKRRSLRQNALYHQWCGIIASETGDSHNAVHEGLKHEFLAPREIEVFGKTIQAPPSTKSLKTDEMSLYMEQVSAWAASFLGVALPHPSDIHAR